MASMKQRNLRRGRQNEQTEPMRGRRGALGTDPWSVGSGLATLNRGCGGLSLDPPIGWMGQAGDEWLADRFAGEHVKAESVTAGGERGDDTVEEPPRCW